MSSKVKSTLLTLLVARDIATEQAAREFVEGLDVDVAKKLLKLIQDGSIGSTRNLQDGEGGFLAGLTKIFESKSSERAATLPDDPKSMTKGEKKKAAQEYEQAMAKSDKELVDGLKLVLSAKRQERKEDLGTWAVELSDPDFPIAIVQMDKKQKKADEALVEEVDETLERARKKAKEIAKSHKNHD